MVKRRKSATKNPTPRQEAAAKRYAESIMAGDNKQQKDILKEAGYSKAVQGAPTKVTSTDGFKAALAKYMPMDAIVGRHKQLMNQNDNLPTAMKAVEKAYDLHGVNAGKGSQPYAQFIQLVVGQNNAQEQQREVIDVDLGNTRE